MILSPQRIRHGASNRIVVAALAAGATILLFTYLLGTIVGSQQARTTPVYTDDAVHESTSGTGTTDGAQQPAGSESSQQSTRRQRSPSSPLAGFQPSSQRIARGLTLEPPSINALSDTQGVFTITSIDGSAFEVIRVNHQPPTFIDFDPESDDPRARYEIVWDVSDVDVDTCVDPEGQSIPSWFLIETTYPTATIQDLQIIHPCTTRARRVGFERWLVSERRVMLVGLRPGESDKFATRIVWPPDAVPDDPITAVYSESDLFTAELVELWDTSLGPELLVRVTPAEGVRGPFQGEIRFESASGKSDWTMVLGSVVYE